MLVNYSILNDEVLAVHSKPQVFGGGWSSLKLEAVISFLTAYRKVMLKQKFHLIYVDAFAGSGLILQRTEGDSGEFLFPVFCSCEPNWRRDSRKDSE